MGSKPKRGLLRYRELRRVLERGGATLLRITGSHRLWGYTVPGVSGLVTYSIPAHDDGDEVRPVYIKRLRQTWKLQEADGVSDDAFFDGHWQRGPDEA